MNVLNVIKDNSDEDLMSMIELANYHGYPI